MQLRRSLGPLDAVLFFVVAGSNLQWVAAAAAAGASSLSVWLIGCFAMFVPLSISVVFLSSHYPDEGGLYVWSKRAFGPFAGFMTGWTYWASNLPYFPALLYFAAGNALFIAGSHGRALAGSPRVLHRGRARRLDARDDRKRLWPANRKVAHQCRRHRALERDAAASRARGARLVEVWHGNAIELAPRSARACSSKTSSFGR